MDAVNGGYNEVCTHLKGVKGWCWVVCNNPCLFSVAGNLKKKKVLHGNGWVWTVEEKVPLLPVLPSVVFQQLSW